MSEKQATVNTFQKGRRKNIDSAQVSQQAYLDSINGRIIFNEDGTYAWENARGTKFVFSLLCEDGTKTDYKPIGSGYINGKLVVFSTNSFNGEIGIVTQDQFTKFVYKTLFNDKFDPNGDNLRFSIKHNIRINGIEENNQTEEVYFNDDYNEPRVFNLLAGAAFNWLPAYPTWYSVHGIELMPDLTWGLQKYVRTTGGNLLSGKYQYAYRYLHKTGYSSPWSPLSRGITVSSKTIDAGNWTKYDMGVSGETTSKGIELEIKYLDQRFQQVEVVAVYWKNNVAADNARLVFKGDITSGSISVFHTEQGGEIVTLDELKERFFAIKKAKAQAISQDNFYHLGNIETYPNLQVETKNITAEPITRLMLSDETRFTQNLPLTNQTPKNTTVTKRLMSGAGGNIDEVYVVDNEYINYKGTQWDVLFPGNFRRERYPYALVALNRKGQPMFAQHVTDFTFPEQYNNQCQDARLSGTTNPTFGANGDYVITNYTPGSLYQITDTIQQGENICPRIMGIKFGNIDLTDILFDSRGDLQISGFMIVRMDRIASIVAQGVLCNTVRNSTDACNYTDETRPLPSAYNYLRYNGANPTNLYIGQMQNDCAINARGYWHTFEAPDYFIDQTIFQTSSVQDKIRLVGACHTISHPAGNGNFIEELAGSHGHFYSKNYFTPFTGWDSILDGVNEQVGVSGFGNEFRIEKLFADATDIDNILGSLFWRRYSGIQNYLSLASTFPDDDWSAISHHHTLLIDTDQLITCSIKIGTLYVCNYIANYLKPVSFPQLTQSLLQNRVYNGCGHFVPINATTLAAAFNNITNRYVFNDIEVWGGDCFVDYFGYARLLPGYFEPGYEHVADCDLDPKPDYSIGLMFPIESKFNIAMRSGDSYPKVGTEPFATYCGDDSVFQNGIYYAAEDNQKKEDFNVNTVLQLQNPLSFYEVNKDTRPEVTDFPVREVYSDQKFYGEFIDSFRKFRINNFQDAKGEYGEITDLQFLAPFNSIYVLQRLSFARIRFNDRQFVSTEQGPVTTGTGEGYQGHDYISVEVGCQHQWSVVNSGRALHWMDAEKGRQVSFGQNGVTYPSEFADAKDLMFRLRNYWIVDDPGNVLTDGERRFYDNPTYLGGVHGVFDFKNNSVVFSFTKRREVQDGDIVQVGEPFTIEYNETMSEYVDTPLYCADWYMQMKHGFFSCDNVHPADSNKVYFHDEGIRGQIYGDNLNSKLRFAINVRPTDAKVFDNAKLMVSDALGASIIKQAQLNTNIVNSQVVILNNSAVDNRPEYREGELWYPMMLKGQKQRLRGQYAIVEYEIVNDGSDKVARITAQTTYYRLSSKV